MNGLGYRQTTAAATNYPASAQGRNTQELLPATAATLRTQEDDPASCSRALPG